MPAVHSYTKPECQAFAELMDQHVQVYHYRGRYGFEGPGANFSSHADAVNALAQIHYEMGYQAANDPDHNEYAGISTIPVQFDNMGLGVVMYTQRKDPGKFDYEADDDDY